MSEGATDPTTYEEAYERLRRAVEELEAGPMPLEKAIARYEEGMRLAQLCNDMLDRAELRVHHVLRDPEGRAGES
jgi:exodeoxyribonuclease VII small subunit